METNRPNKKVCSIACREIFDGKFSNLEKKLSPPTTGAVSELMVSVDLLKKGYAVFRALSPACFCDLIAIKNEETLLVEVRTGYKSKDGIFHFSKELHTNNGKPNIYAVCVPGTGEIGYIKIF